MMVDPISPWSVPSTEVACWHLKKQREVKLVDKQVIDSGSQFVTFVEYDKDSEEPTG